MTANLNSYCMPLILTQTLNTLIYLIQTLFVKCLRKLSFESYKIYSKLIKFNSRAIITTKQQYKQQTQAKKDSKTFPFSDYVFSFMLTIKSPSA